MTARNNASGARSFRRRDERWIAVAGCAGLLAATFAACNDAGSDASSAGGAAGAGGGSTASGAGGANAACAQSGDTVQNTADVVGAANTLLSELTSAQQTTIQLTASLENAEQWSNLPTNFIPRNGVMLGDMSAEAQDAAALLVTTAAGSQGGKLFSELRLADEFLVTDGHASADGYGAGRYYIAFIGTPSTTSPWMLQIAGHHLAYNFTYNGTCTSATPLFDGVEPTSWTDPNDGTSHAPLENQRAASVAVIGAIAGDPASLLAGSFTDVVNGPTNANGKGDARYPKGLTYPTGSSGRGVLVGSLSAEKQALVKTAIESWVKNVADPISSALLTDYESDAALAETYVAYSGAADLTTQLSYFRIDGPRVWIEYTVQGGIVYKSRVHYHTLWRDKQADYGAEYADSDAGGAGG